MSPIGFNGMTLICCFLYLTLWSAPDAMESEGKKLQWLDRYTGQTVNQLLALEGKYRIDSLVLVFEEALDQKEAREGEHALSNEERIVLAVEALQREVDNG